ncbi:MAG TPA: prolyl oligopeptidase family serine peptidase [Oleiagrimonas sp.]|nr:prolyl oligopeptidase family serine peptidase [Oleiagrimonas sp.]
MRRNFLATVAAAAVATALGLTPAHASEPVPIKALSRQPALQSITMSPDGEHLVGLIRSPNNKKETALAVWDTDDLKAGPTVVTPSGDHMKFIGAYALKADKIFAVARQEWTGQLSGCGEGKLVGATRTFITKAYLTGLKQKNFHLAFASDRHQTGISDATRTCMKIGGSAGLVSMLPQSPTDVIIERTSGLTLGASYYRYNLKTGATELLFKGDPRTAPVLFDPHTGKLLVRMRIKPISGDYIKEFLFRNPKTGKFEVEDALSSKMSNRYAVDVVGVDDATGKYYVLTNQFSDKIQARVYDPVTNKYDPEPLLANPDYSIAGLVFGKQPVNFNKIVGFVIGGPHRETVYIAPKLKAIQQSLKHAFPGQQIDIAEYTNHFGKVLFTTSNASTPPAYHLLLNGKQVVNIGSKRPWIDKDSVAHKERWITYTARDGMKIHAILDLPVGWEKSDGPGPAIVLPHGGPWARDFMAWDRSGWVPMLVSRGYAVLRPEYRGSAGLGRKLWLAGDAQWGLKMSNDLDDGAKWLVAQGIADKDKIAIFGYSYGGFAAVAADVRSPSPYQCAIAGAPVADLGRLGTTWSTNRMQRIVQGKTVKGMDPMQNINKAHLPIMLFAGDRDVRVPHKIHAEAFYNAVKDIVPAQFHVIPDMPHSMPWYPRQKNKTDHLILNFLAQHCGLATPDNPA